MSRYLQVHRSRAIAVIFDVLSLSIAAGAHAQAANAGAEFNNAERARMQEDRRLDQLDKPLKPDVLGNAIMGGVVTGAVKGGAAGAVSTIRGAGIGSAVQEAKVNREENRKSGRGGESDPRYDPRSLFEKR